MAKKKRKVAEIMSPGAEYVVSGTHLMDAARKMRELDCGFLPVSDSGEKKLQGVITDRDIVLRAIAEGRDPKSTTVDEILSNRVLYCLETDAVQDAAKSMHDQRVYRLVVLDNPTNKHMCGIITLNDIVRHEEQAVAMSAAGGIAA